MQKSEIALMVRLHLCPLFKFVENSQDKNGKVTGTLVRQNNVFNRTEKLEAAGFSEW